MITGTSTTASAPVAGASPSCRPSKGLHCNHRKCVPWRSRHFNQLFSQLRRTEDCASTPWWTHDLGNFDNLLGQRLVEDLQDTHQLFHLLPLDHEEQRDHRNRVGDLLRGVPQDPLLRPGLPELSRPHLPRRRHFLVGAQLEVLVVCVLLSPWGVVHSGGTGWLLSP